MEQRISGMTVGPILSLKKGDWFLSSRDGKYVTGWIIHNDNSRSAWVEFSAQSAVIRRSDPFTRTDVLRLEVAGDLQVRFDPAFSTPVAVPGHGQLVVSPEDGACVAVTWAGAAPDEQAANLISLRDGNRTSMTNPAFIFDVWSLGYLGAGGEWVEVVRRSPSA